MYTVILFTKVLPQHVDDYIQNMRVCAEKTNQEPGCIRYEVMQDVADPTLMCLFQVFEDEAAYQYHQDAEHHRVWIEMSGGWRDPSVRQRHEMRFITPSPARTAV
jgi:(4S)-4-hydroxy-5-phosphonooxypentane-2,3-dione isomerase